MSKNPEKLEKTEDLVTKTNQYEQDLKIAEERFEESKKNVKELKRELASKEKIYQKDNQDIENSKLNLQDQQNSFEKKLKKATEQEPTEKEAELIKKAKQNWLEAGNELEQKIDQHESAQKEIASLKQKLSTQEKNLKQHRNELEELERKGPPVAKKLESIKQKQEFTPLEVTSINLQSPQIQQVKTLDSPKPSFAKLTNEPGPAPFQVESFAQVTNVTPGKSDQRVNLFDQIQKEGSIMSKEDKDIKRAIETKEFVEKTLNQAGTPIDPNAPVTIIDKRQPVEEKFDFDKALEKAGKEVAQLERELKEQATGTQKTTPITLDSPKVPVEKTFDLEKELGQLKEAPVRVTVTQQQSQTPQQSKEVPTPDQPQQKSAIIVEAPKPNLQTAQQINTKIDNPGNIPGQQGPQTFTVTKGVEPTQVPTSTEVPKSQSQNATISGKQPFTISKQDIEDAKNYNAEQELDNLLKGLETGNAKVTPQLETKTSAKNEPPKKEMEELLNLLNEVERKIEPAKKLETKEETKTQAQNKENPSNKEPYQKVQVSGAYLTKNDLKKAYNDPKKEPNSSQSKKIAQNLMKATTKEQQANFLYSAIIDGKENVAKALAEEMNKGKTASNPNKFKKDALQEIRTAAENYKKEHGIKESTVEQEKGTSQKVKEPKKNIKKPKEVPTKPQTRSERKKEREEKRKVEQEKKDKEKQIKKEERQKKQEIGKQTTAKEKEKFRQERENEKKLFAESLKEQEEKVKASEKKVQELKTKTTEVEQKQEKPKQKKGLFNRNKKTIEKPVTGITKKEKAKQINAIAQNLDEKIKENKETKEKKKQELADKINKSNERKNTSKKEEKTQQVLQPEQPQKLDNPEVKKTLETKSNDPKSNEQNVEQVKVQQGQLQAGEIKQSEPQNVTKQEQVVEQRDVQKNPIIQKQESEKIVKSETRENVESKETPIDPKIQVQKSEEVKQEATQEQVSKPRTNLSNDDFAKVTDKLLGTEAPQQQLASAGITTERTEEKSMSKDESQKSEKQPTQDQQPQTNAPTPTQEQKQQSQEINQPSTQKEEQSNPYKDGTAPGLNPFYQLNPNQQQNPYQQQTQQQDQQVANKLKQGEEQQRMSNEENAIKQNLANFKTKNEQGRYASSTIADFPELKPIIEKQLLDQKGDIKWSQEEVNKIKESPETALTDYNKLVKEEKSIENVTAKTQPIQKVYSKVDIDQTIEQINKRTGEDLATKDPQALAQSLLQNKTKDQQADMLYSAVVGGKDNIIGPLKQQMRENGIDNKDITNILIEGEKAASANKNMAGPEQKENKYTKVDLLDPKNPLIKRLGPEVAQSDPVAFAQSLLQNKSKEEQANILYSAVVEGKGDRMFNTLVSKMQENNNFTNAEITNIVAGGKENAYTEFAREVASVRLANLENKIDLGDPQKEKELKEKEKETESKELKTEKHEEKSSKDTLASGDIPSKTTDSPSKPGVESSAITDAMRTEILEKQNKVLQNAIAGSLKDEKKKEEISGMDPATFRDYLKTEEGKKLAAEEHKKPEIKAQLNEVSVAGYKKVHEDFKENFKDVSWQENKDQPNTKTSQIKNDKGELVADIKETTHSTKPVSLTLEDGTTKTVSSYRTIDFPPKLEKENGPLHLSMALKDENGKNMPEKDALYFSAHYDKSGKLTEVTSPTPVKFMGEGKDAVGYIEKDGKVFTLPVTQGKYEEMMKEVAVNKGHSVDLSQKVEVQSTDKQLTTEIKKEEKEKEKPKEPEMPNQGVMGKNIETKGKEITENLHKDKKEEQKPEVKQTQDFKIYDNKEINLKEMDKLLAGKQPEEVKNILIDQIGMGNNKVAKSIVNATNSSRTDRPKDTPELVKEDLQGAYAGGMNKSMKATSLEHQKDIHTAAAVIVDAGAISNKSHTEQVKFTSDTLGSRIKETNIRVADGLFAGKTAEEARKMLVEEIKNGSELSVNSMVEATKPSRTDRPKDTPQLTEKDFKIAYHEAMKNAKDAPNQYSQGNTHRRAALLIPEAKIQPQVHPGLVKENTQQLNKNQDKGMSHSK